MRSALWFVVGIAVGVAAADRIRRSPRGRALLDGLDARAREFTDGIVDGYRSRDAELRDTGSRDTGA